MSYAAEFHAFPGADWAEAVELIDDDTNLALVEADDAAFEIEVRDDCGSRRLYASTADATIQKPEPNVIRWRFTLDQIAALNPATTYGVFIRMTTDEGTEYVIVGSLALGRGGFN